ncbi:preprotein translocase subunit SecG [Candidatus Saccharibacteria bacterium]|nr:preprotein translocase subunit SecG [Candidatus Saccharibacteria bacterium]
MNSIFDYITFGSSVFLVILILIQTRGASLGAGLGGGSDIEIVRRGSDKTLHQMTIATVAVFAGSLIAGFLA